MSRATWDQFVARLDAVYLSSLTPQQRALTCEDAAIPADLWQAAKIIFPNPEAWLDNPIPQLDGHSAREVIATGDADKVREIMMGVAEFFLPPEDEVIPYAQWEQGSEVPPEGEAG